MILGITGCVAGDQVRHSVARHAGRGGGAGVAGVIIWIGSRLGKRTLEALLDVAPGGLREHITDAVDETEGVLKTERVRVRRAGQRYFVDVTISVAAHGEPRTGARRERRGRTEDRADRSGGRGGPRGAAGAQQRAFVRDDSRDRAAPRPGRPRTFGAPATRGGSSSSCTWKWTKEPACAKRTATPPSSKQEIRERPIRRRA